MQKRLALDPAMRIVTGKKHKKNAASANTMGRFETEMLTADDNVALLEKPNRRWVQKAMDRTSGKRIILDMDSSERPVHGEQEGSAYNGHFNIRCFHPLFCFNQLAT